jgi:hypothetical protein
MPNCSRYNSAGLSVNLGQRIAITGMPDMTTLVIPFPDRPSCGPAKPPLNLGCRCRNPAVPLMMAAALRLPYSHRKNRTATNAKTSVYPTRVRRVATGGVVLNSELRMARTAAPLGEYHMMSLSGAPTSTG